MTLSRLDHYHHASVQLHQYFLYLKFSCSFEHNVIFSIWMGMANFASANLSTQASANREW